MPSTPNSNPSLSPMPTSKVPTSSPNPQGLGISMSYAGPIERQHPDQWVKQDPQTNDLSKCYDTPPHTPMPDVDSWSPHNGVENMFDPTYFPSTPIDDDYFLPTANAYGHGSANNFFSIKNSDPIDQCLQNYLGGSDTFGMQTPYVSCITPASFLEQAQQC